MIGLYVTVAAIVFVVIIYLLLGNVIARVLLHKRKRRRGEALRKEFLVNISYDDMFLSEEKIFIENRQGEKLFARQFICHDSHKWVILLHGYGSSSISNLKYVKVFRAKGYNVLCPDNRHSGLSEGKNITFGFFEKNDVSRWLEYIYHVDDNAKIGLFGASLGAATAILTASERPDITFLVSYCSYSYWERIIKEKAVSMMGGVAKLFMPTIKLGIYRVSKAIVPAVDLREAIKFVRCPVLLLHSKKDDFTSVKHARELRTIRPDVDYYEFERGLHAKAYSKDPELYSSLIQNFLTKV